MSDTREITPAPPLPAPRVEALRYSQGGAVQCVDDEGYCWWWHCLPVSGRWVWSRDRRQDAPVPALAAALLASHEALERANALLRECAGHLDKRDNAMLLEAIRTHLAGQPPAAKGGE